MSNLIGKIICDPVTPRPAESVRIEVFDTDEKLFVNTETIVKINGIIGNVQYLQFVGEGPRRLNIEVITKDGLTDSKTIVLQIKGKPLKFQLSSKGNNEKLAIISLSQSSVYPYKAKFTLGSSIDTRSLMPLSSNLITHPKVIKVANVNELKNFIVKNAKNFEKTNTALLNNQRKSKILNKKRNS